LQVPLAELEAFLITHPNIDDVAVIGVPDIEAGELPKAFVVRRGNMTAEEIVEFVAKKVQPQKKLRGGVEFVDQIPKSASGKIYGARLEDKKKQSVLWLSCEVTKCVVTDLMRSTIISPKHFGCKTSLRCFEDV